VKFWYHDRAYRRPASRFSVLDYRKKTDGGPLIKTKMWAVFRGNSSKNQALRKALLSRKLEYNQLTERLNGRWPE
jgi:hypothetical protein